MSPPSDTKSFLVRGTTRPRISCIEGWYSNGHGDAWACQVPYLRNCTCPIGDLKVNLWLMHNLPHGMRHRSKGLGVG
jgi:hypothetical protein